MFVVFNHCVAPQTPGSAANQDERNAALTTANLFIKDKNYSPTTQVIWQRS